VCADLERYVGQGTMCLLMEKTVSFSSIFLTRNGVHLGAGLAGFDGVFVGHVGSDERALVDQGVFALIFQQAGKRVLYVLISSSRAIVSPLTA
jgi:hypothetical protein